MNVQELAPISEFRASGAHPTRATKFMHTITFVTGNDNKIAEARAILPFEIEREKINLDEIQSLDVREIVKHKLHQAYEILKRPVMVDDVSAELESLNGLPGPFMKFFEQRLGKDALYQINKPGSDKVKVICTIGYYDGEHEEIVEGVVHGTVVPARGEDGWGFDFVVMPEGYTQTWAEMGREKKNKTSHRHAALTLMAEKLKNL
jgi:inosine triphosphate pyrophosphatase